MGRYIFIAATFLSKTWTIWLVIFLLSIGYHLVIDRVHFFDTVIWWLAKSWWVWAIVLVLAAFFRMTLGRVTFG